MLCVVSRILHTYVLVGLVTRMHIVCLEDGLIIQGNPNKAPQKIEKV